MKKLLQAELSDIYTGLTGSVGYTFYNSDGSINTARSTVGVYESPSGSGTYWVDATIPDYLNGFVSWDIIGYPEVSATDEINTANQEPYIDPGTLNLYCTYADIDNELDDLDDRIPKKFQGDSTGWVEAQIYKTMREIDGRLGGIYTIPFTSPIPQIIRTVCIYLSVSRILSPGYVGELPAESKYVDTYYKRGDDLLKSILDGKISISEGISSNGSGVYSAGLDRDPVFIQTAMVGDDIITEGNMDPGW